MPISPALGRLLRKHLAEHGTAPDGRLFRSESGDLVSDSVISRTWDKARKTTLTPAEYKSPLAERPYDLRHARLSTWLNAGIAPPQVAEWAGNSVVVHSASTPNASPTPSNPPSNASSKPNPTSPENPNRPPLPPKFYRSRKE